MSAKTLVTAILKRKLSVSTVAEYKRVASRSNQLTSEQIGALRKSNRRVVIAATKRDLATAWCQTTNEEVRKEIGVKLSDFCTQFPDRDAWLKSQDERSLEALFSAQLSEKTSVVERSQSKRTMLKTLPGEWRNQVLSAALKSRSKHSPAIALLSVSGVRPCELEAGISVRISSGNIEIAVGNGKQRGKASQRVLTIDRDTNPAARYLARVAEKLGGEYIVKIESKNALRNALRRFGERLFDANQDVTAYTYRHAFASDAKSAGLGTVGVAKALGHGSDRMQGRYGHANQSKIGAQSLSVQSTLEPRAERGLQMLRIKTQSLQRSR